MMVQEYDVYIEYGRMVELIETVITLQNKLKHKLSPVNLITNIIECNLKLIQTLQDRYFKEKDIYNFNNERYFQKVEFHHSLLIGYHSVLMCFEQYSLVKRFKMHSQFKQNILDMKKRLVASCDVIAKIPLKKGRRKLNECGVSINLSEISFPPNPDEMIKRDSKDISLTNHLPLVSPIKIQFSHTRNHSTNEYSLNNRHFNFDINKKELRVHSVYPSKRKEFFSVIENS
ncbi:hypothetical protein K502DRAFT_322475, partial [Neoconidiobolus thromboides FSU 785]